MPEKSNDISSETRRNVIRRLVQVPIGWIFIALVLFSSAGTVGWQQGWIFIGLLVAVDLIGLPFIPLEVLAERGSKKKNIENWDKVLGKLIILSMISMFLTAGLDYRWKLTGIIDFRVQIISIILFVLGCVLNIWAMRVNYFFSDVVRLQPDREQKVCSSGPYKYIRHPGYLGMIIYYLVTPFILGSLWALIPASLIMILFIIRTRLEDKTLMKKLSGYKKYADSVKYRIIPKIW